jgi:hypothetical protein
VHTQDGLKPIEHISEGDQVLSFAEWNDQKSHQSVEAVIRNEKDYDLYTITLDNGDTINSTDGHPLYVPTQGWTDARLLKAGDHLYLQSRGTVRIKTITTEHKHETVYNLSVANTHTFFVGEEGVLVHNTNCEQALMEALAKYDKNDIHHLFGRGGDAPTKLMEKFGSPEAALKELQKSAQAIATNNYQTGSWVTVKVGDIPVTIKGIVQNGVFRISSIAKRDF